MITIILTGDYNNALSVPTDVVNDPELLANYIVDHYGSFYWDAHDVDGTWLSSSEI